MVFTNDSVGIGISCYNRLENVKRILWKLRQLKIVPSFTVVFASDGCKDGTQEFLRSRKDVTSIIAQNQGVGVNKGRLLKVLKKFKYIFLLEDDILPLSRNFISNGIEICTKTSLEHLNYGVTAKFKEDVFEKIPVYSSGTLNGQVMFLTQKVLKEVGYFNPTFGKYGYEHVEWTHRIVRAHMYRWGPFYTFFEPHKLFAKLPEKGGMDPRVKIDWVHRRNKGKLGKYLANAGLFPIFLPEPKLKFEVIGKPLS